MHVVDSEFNSREVELNITSAHVQVVVSMEVHLEVHWFFWILFRALFADSHESFDSGGESLVPDSLPHV